MRPLGETGPFVRPGDGAVHLIAHEKGQALATTRDLSQERSHQKAMIAQCPALAMSMDQDHTAYLSRAEDALDALLQLEDLAKAHEVTVHWPQGRSMHLAYRASAKDCRLHIRKDRDWFAVSGTLPLDQSLSLDILTLIDMLAVSPGRFIKLDDGRFLALAEELKQRIEELAIYGTRHNPQKKLRLPPVRATALSHVGDSVTLKADAHWNAWQCCLQDADKMVASVPSALQTELRAYQVEGFQWLVRLATWGMDACLADDMGLGKTIEAIALLLERAPQGLALIVAPTSVISNWQREIHRFAPTLNPVLLGPGDRKKNHHEA